MLLASLRCYSLHLWWFYLEKNCPSSTGHFLVFGGGLNACGDDLRHQFTATMVFLMNLAKNCPNAGCIIDYGSSLKMNSQYINTNLIPRINEWAKITSPWQVRVTSALSAFLRSSATCLPRKVSPRLPRKVFSIFAAYFRNQMISATSNCSDKSKTCPWLKLTN